MPPPSSTPNKSVQKAATVRLPPLPRLKVRRPNKLDANPCLSIMSSVLTCWASSGYNVQGCAKLEQQLRACMDAPAAKQQKKNTINYHLQRLYPQMKGPHKRK